MFCANASEDSDRLKSGPVKKQNFYLFRMIDLKDYLNQQRFKELPDNKILSAIKQVLKADAVTHTIKNPKLNVRCWRIHKDNLRIDPSTPFPDLTVNEPY